MCGFWFSGERRQQCKVFWNTLGRFLCVNAHTVVPDLAQHVYRRTLSIQTHAQTHVLALENHKRTAALELAIYVLKVSPICAQRVCQIDGVSVFEAAELDAIALLGYTCNDDLDPEVSAQLVEADVLASFPSERRKVRARARQGQGQGHISCSSIIFAIRGSSTTTERTEGKNRMPCLHQNGKYFRRSRRGH